MVFQRSSAYVLYAFSCLKYLEPNRLRVHIARCDFRGAYHFVYAQAGGMYVDGVIHHSLVISALHADVAGTVGEVGGICRYGVDSPLCTGAASPVHGDITAALCDEGHALAVSEYYLIQYRIVSSVQYHSGVWPSVVAQHEYLPLFQPHFGGIDVKAYAVCSGGFALGGPWHVSGLSRGYHAPVCFECQYGSRGFFLAVSRQVVEPVFYTVTELRGKLQCGGAFRYFYNFSFVIVRGVMRDGNAVELYIRAVHDQYGLHGAVEDKGGAIAVDFDIFEPYQWQSDGLHVLLVVVGDVVAEPRCAARVKMVFSLR